MSDQCNPTGPTPSPDQPSIRTSTESSPTPPASSTDSPRAGADALEQAMANGKVLGALSYAGNLLGVPLGFIPLFMSDNALTLFHGKHSVSLCIFTIPLPICFVMGAVISVVLFPPGVCVLCVAVVGAGIGSTVLNIIVIAHALSARATPLPVLGAWFDSWFRSLTPKSPASSR